MAQQASSLSHAKRTCKHRIVFAPEYRRKVIYSQYRASAGEVLRRLCPCKGAEITGGRLTPDRVRMLVGIPPKMSAPSFTGCLEGKGSLMMFEKHGNLKCKFGSRKFWREGCCVSAVGRNEAAIKKRIREQEARGMALDKLSVKEYEDPLAG